MDLIDRQAAIHDLCKTRCGCEPEECCLTFPEDGAEECADVRWLLSLPSAEPELATNLQQSCNQLATDTISRQDAINAVHKAIYRYFIIAEDGEEETPMCEQDELLLSVNKDICKGLKELPSAQPEIIRCKDCKHNPKDEWFGCPMSHLSEAQRPETAWCWKGERRTDAETEV